MVSYWYGPFPSGLGGQQAPGSLPVSTSSVLELQAFAPRLAVLAPPSWVLESKLMSSCSQGKHFTNKAISSVLLLGKLDTSTGDWLDLVIATPTDAPLGGLGGPRRKQQHPLGWDVQSGATLVLKEKPYSSPTHTVHPRS